MENETQKPEDKLSAFDNIVKHLVTTVLGIVLMGASVIDGLTKWDMPTIEGVTRSYQLVFVFAAGFAHLFAKDTLVEKVKNLFGNK